MDLIIYTDGASRGNPGKASYGFVIKTKDGVILHQEGKRIGDRETNNLAEYTGALKALEYVKDTYSKKAPHRIDFRADSKLIIEQLSGRFKVKNPHLREIYWKVKAIEMELGRIDYKHIPRKENFIADRLANQALDSSN